MRLSNIECHITFIFNGTIAILFHKTSSKSIGNRSNEEIEKRTFETIYQIFTG